jgi:hypothetical protein
MHSNVMRSENEVGLTSARTVMAGVCGRVADCRRSFADLHTRSLTCRFDIRCRTLDLFVRRI